jgi:hypothetical protein
MKSRHDRVRASVLAVVMVLGVVGWATAQDPKNAPVKGSGTPGTIPLWTSSNTLATHQSRRPAVT